MKKVLSVVLMFCILCGMLSSFSFISAAEADTMYSGGSGTEDDPYLISDRHDIQEMYDNIVSNPYLWSEKKYYKLTNNISTKETFSPLYEFEGYGMGCLVLSPYSVEDILHMFNGYDNSNTYDEHNEGVFKSITNTMGYLYIHREYYDREFYTLVDNIYEDYDTAYSLFFNTRLVYNNKDIVEDYHNRLGSTEFRYDPNLYRKAAFTGVFDGNGYTIFGNDLCLFGFLENGGEIKNLTVSGNNLSLAYYVGEGCSVTNCTFDVVDGVSFTYLSERTKKDGMWSQVGEGEFGYSEWIEMPHISEKYSTENGVIHNNRGTVSQCINKKDLEKGLVGTNGGRVTDILSHGTIGGLSAADKGLQRILVPDSDKNSANDEIYTESECKGAGGDTSFYKDFDFTNVWIMRNGVPFLRMGLESGTGDVNLDGLVNSIDSNLLRRCHADDHTVPESIYPFAGDMDKNDRLDAVDSIRLKLYIIGK